MNNKTFKTILIFLFSLLVITILINLNIGFIKLGLADFIDANAQNSQIAELRINRVLAMFLAGVSIPTSGFLLQEYFQNPLARTFGSWDNFCCQFKCCFLHLFFLKISFYQSFCKMVSSVFLQFLEAFC